MGKEKMTGGICTKCGVAADPATSLCPKCGSPVPDGSAGTRSRGVWSTVFSVLLAVLLTAAAVGTVILLFVHALGENISLPAAGFVSDSMMAAFFDSRLSLAFIGAVTAIPLLALILINMRRMRRAFLAIGVSSSVAAVISAAGGITAGRLFALMPGEWQDILLPASYVFRQFSIVCAVIMLAVAIGCISVYSCIRAVKGGAHE